MTLGVVVTLSALAQADAAMSHFWVGKSYYNPAVAGDENVIHMNLGSRMQWVDFKHAPMTFFLTVDMQDVERRYPAWYLFPDFPWP